MSSPIPSVDIISRESNSDKYIEFIFQYALLTLSSNIPSSPLKKDAKNKVFLPGRKEEYRKKSSIAINPLKSLNI